MLVMSSYIVRVLFLSWTQNPGLYNSTMFKIPMCDTAFLNFCQITTFVLLHIKILRKRHARSLKTPLLRQQDRQIFLLKSILKAQLLGLPSHRPQSIRTISAVASYNIRREFAKKICVIGFRDRSCIGGVNSASLVETFSNHRGNVAPCSFAAFTKEVRVFETRFGIWSLFGPVKDLDICLRIQLVATRI